MTYRDIRISGYQDLGIWGLGYQVFQNTQSPNIPISKSQYPNLLIPLVCIIILLGVCHSLCFASEEKPNPPFTGQAKVDNVNVRAGGSQNFEILCKVNKDDLLFVLDEADGWYKITLPKSAACYVWKDFIEINAGGGFSKVSNLNLRARPNTQSSVMGQLTKGDAVTILNEDAQGWYQISPPENSYGWVHAALIAPQPAKKEPAAKESKPKKESEPEKPKKRRFLWW